VSMKNNAPGQISLLHKL